MTHKKAFLSVSLQGRDSLQAEFAVIHEVLAAFGMEAIDFTKQFTFTFGQEKAMMKHARDQIQAADLLIAEVSEKAIGVGVEIGYAVAVGKPVLYIRKSPATYSTTVGGMATKSFVYTDTDDLRIKLTQFMEKFALPTLPD